jgi:hypothetical protein
MTKRKISEGLVLAGSKCERSELLPACPSLLFDMARTTASLRADDLAIGADLLLSDVVDVMFSVGVVNSLARARARMRASGPHLRALSPSTLEFT